MGFFSPINQLISILFKSICFLFLAMCTFQFNLQSKCSPRYFTTSVWGIIVWLMLTAGQWTFRRVNVMCDDLGSLTLMWHMLKRNWNHPLLQTITIANASDNVLTTGTYPAIDSAVKYKTNKDDHNIFVARLKQYKHKTE